MGWRVGGGEGGLCAETSAVAIIAETDIQSERGNTLRQLRAIEYFFYKIARPLLTNTDISLFWQNIPMSDIFKISPLNSTTSKADWLVPGEICSTRA